MKLITAIVGALVLAGLGVAQNKGRGPRQDARLIDSIEGPALYSAYCAVCHGADGKGMGPMAQSLKTPPADLTRLAARRRGVFPRAEVARIISGEQSTASGHGTREMPVWGPIFSQVGRDQDFGQVRLDNLVQYLEKIQER